MKDRIFIILLLLCSHCAVTMAQNKIDVLVEKCSAVGHTSFTSVVKRDPETREIKKVVKMLSIPYSDVRTFKVAFEDESNTGQYSVTTNPNGMNTHLLITDSNRKTRIYMLEYRKYRNGNVTIIIK